VLAGFVDTCAPTRTRTSLLPMDGADENAIIVNALQRRADVAVQKSIAEAST